MCHDCAPEAALSERFTFFWDGPFSQWHPCRFVVDHVTYNCAEQYMMAAKARLFGDRETERLILAASAPRVQKCLGRAIRPFDDTMWLAAARAIVYCGNRAKFTQNEDLLDRLLATRGTTLVEASPHDRLWGIGLAEDDVRAKDRANWRGKNWLGEILTELRDALDRRIEL